ARRLDEDTKTLEDLSQKYSISRERVRQIENKAIKKLQDEIKLISDTKLLSKK
ncbi:MAG: sigma factor-like helix-turn-helix DNA-binding protein, partial [Alphaproteobacteria bacterium]|nr:sigma factor-like helix-turn-helix DNA-binding protein [Alphaproteobacteria bacterium]